jgi:hypothetical protein
MISKTQKRWHTQITHSSFFWCTDTSNVGIGGELTQTPKNLRFDQENFSSGLFNLKKDGTNSLFQPHSFEHKTKLYDVGQRNDVHNFQA